MEYTGLILIVYILFFALVNASIATFLDKTFDEGMIFQGYLPWLAKRTLGKRAHVEGLREDANIYTSELMEKAARETFWFKPLGGCVVCFSVWLSMPVYLLCIWLFKVDFSLWAHIALWFIYATISNLMVRKI